MTPQAMGDFIVKATKEFSLDRPHLIAPDIGTSASLCAAAANESLFSILIVGGGAMDAAATAGPLKAMIEAPDTSAFSGADGGDTVVSMLRTFMKAPTDEQLEDYRISYLGGRFVESMAYFRSFPRTLPPLLDRLSGIQTPTLVIYGSQDPVVPPANAEILGRSLPHVKVIPLECGHFAWADKADEYSSAALAWINDHAENDLAISYSSAMRNTK